MYSNDQVKEKVIELTRALEIFINNMEDEMQSEDPDLKIVSMNLGKLSQNYVLLCELSGVFTGEDWREGGFRESSRKSSTEEIL